MLFDRISRTEGEVGGQTSSSSACTDAGENLAKEFSKSVLFLFRSRRFLRLVADWGRHEQYLTVLWEGSSAPFAFLGEEKKPIAAGRAAPPRVASWEWVTKLPLGFQSAADPGGSPAAAPMRTPRRRESPFAAVGIAAAANCPLPKCASETLRVWIALTNARAARAGAPGGVLATPPGATKIQLQI